MERYFSPRIGISNKRSIHGKPSYNVFALAGRLIKSNKTYRARIIVGSGSAHFERKIYNGLICVFFAEIKFGICTSIIPTSTVREFGNVFRSVRHYVIVYFVTNIVDIHNVSVNIIISVKHGTRRHCENENLLVINSARHFYLRPLAYRNGIDVRSRVRLRKVVILKRFITNLRQCAYRNGFAFVVSRCFNVNPISYFCYFREIYIVYAVGAIFNHVILLRLGYFERITRVTVVFFIAYFITYSTGCLDVRQIPFSIIKRIYLVCVDVGRTEFF